MKFGELIKMVDTELFITPQHDKWMTENSNATYSAEAVELLTQEVTKTQRVRQGTVSASSLGSCLRKQQFGYLGLPQLPPSAKTAGIFHNGTFTHLRWQMAGITAGWLLRAEVPVGQNPYRIAGTADGLCADGSLLEVKSINDNGFRGVLSFGAKEDHQYQLASYLTAMNLTKGRFIYENKNTQEYVEIPYELTADAELAFATQAARVWAAIDNQELAEPLDKCTVKEGWVYNSCPYRTACLGIKDWEHAQTVVKVEP